MGAARTSATSSGVIDARARVVHRVLGSITDHGAQPSDRAHSERHQRTTARKLASKRREQAKGAGPFGPGESMRCACEQTHRNTRTIKMLPALGRAGAQSGWFA